MITAAHILAAFKSVELSGVKPTDVVAADMAGAARAYAAALADLTPEDLVAAVNAYLRAPPPVGKWWREWPDVGALLAHAPARRRITEAPDDAEATYARLWVIHAGICGSGKWVDGGEYGQKFERRAPERLVIDRSPAGERRERALWAGINALGGWEALAHIGVESRPFVRKDFCTAYRAVMRELPDATGALPSATARPAIGAAPTRDLAQLTTGIGAGGRR